jgi:hypothetical protein
MKADIVFLPICSAETASLRKTAAQGRKNDAENPLNAGQMTACLACVNALEVAASRAEQP